MLILHVRSDNKKSKPEKRFFFSPSVLSSKANFLPHKKQLWKTRMEGKNVLLDAFQLISSDLSAAQAASLR